MWASELGDQIRPLGGGSYSVPSSSGGSTYTVSLTGEDESCDCSDRRHHPELTCKHMTAATIYRARRRARMRREQSMTPCEACSERHPLRELVEVGEANQDGMHPPGTLLCAPCADRMAVER